MKDNECGSQSHKCDIYCVGVRRPIRHRSHHRYRDEIDIRGIKGDTGPQGIQGIKGDTGPQGIPGPKGDNGPQGIPGPKGDNGPQGNQGIKGDNGPQGIPGPKGDNGPQGIPGPKGDTGPQGNQGIKGDNGPQGIPGPKGADSTVQGPIGIQGIPGVIGVINVSNFYALIPSEEDEPIAGGEAVHFPINGPTNNIITRLTSSTFNLPNIGIYEITFQVSVTAAGQLIVVINSIELPYTVVGRATGTTQIIGNCLIKTTIPNSILSIKNPIGNSPAFVVTPLAGGSRVVSSHLIIKQFV